MLLSIDPGLRACGAALWLPEGLYRASLVSGAPKHLTGPDAWRYTVLEVLKWVGAARSQIDYLAFEQPGAYGADVPSRTLNLQELVGVVGFLCAQFPFAAYKRYRPNEWEGTLKRPKSHRDADPVIERIQRRLSFDERARVDLPAPSLAHNVWDAVGVGLKALGRFEPITMYPR
jgi:hypothetical protein